MFSGLGNQISGFVTQKMGKGDAPPPEAEPQEMMVNENGEEVPVNPQGGGGALGGAMGFAQGFMAKAAAAGEGIKAKAGGLGGIQGAPGEGGEQQQMMQAEPQYDENGQLIDPATQEGAQPGAMGFAAGLMMKAHGLKEGLKEKSGGVPGLGQVGGLAGGLMSQVQGVVPGMRKEEEVPEPMPQEGEVYQEYQEGQYQEYQDQQYTEYAEQ